MYHHISIKFKFPTGIEMGVRISEIIDPFISLQRRRFLTRVNKYKRGEGCGSNSYSSSATDLNTWVILLTERQETPEL